MTLGAGCGVRAEPSVACLSPLVLRCARVCLLWLSDRRQQARRSGAERKRTERSGGPAAALLIIQLSARCSQPSPAQALTTTLSLLPCRKKTLATSAISIRSDSLTHSLTRLTSHHAATTHRPHQLGLEPAAPAAHLGPLERNRSLTNHHTRHCIRHCIATWPVDNDTATGSAPSGCRCCARPDERPSCSGVDQPAPCRHAGPAASPAAEPAVALCRFLLKRIRAAVCRRMSAARAPSAVQLRPPAHCTRAQVASRWRHCALLQCACCGSTDFCPSTGSGRCGCHCGRIEQRRCSCGRALLFCCRIHSRCCPVQPAVSSLSLLLPSLSAAGARRQTRRHVAAAAALPLEFGSGSRTGHTHRPQTRGRHGRRSLRHARSRVSVDRTESNARVEEAEI